MPVAERDPVSPLLTDGLVEPLQQSGLVHDEALLSELPSLDLTPYKLVILATTPVLAIVTAWFSRLIQPRYQRNRELVDRMVQFFAESIQGIQVTKAFGREPESQAESNGATARC